MAEKENSENGGIPSNSPPTSEAFPHSTFYDNLLASTLDVPTNTATGATDAFQTWTPYPGNDPSHSLGYNTWSSFASNPDFGNTYADAYATSGHLPTSRPYNQGLEDYFATLGTPSQLDPRSTATESESAQSPYSSPYSGSLQGLNVNMDFMQSAANGRDLYSEAFQQWGSSTAASSIPSADSSASSTSSPPPFTGRAYDPFGTTEVFPNVESVKQSALGAPGDGASPKIAVDILGPTLPPVQPPKPKQTKPSYSDVARNKLINNAQNAAASSKRDESLPRDAFKQDVMPIPYTASIPTATKPKKSKSSRHVAAGSRNRSVTMEPTTIRPDSRYGLDTFDEPGDVLAGVKEKRQSHVSNSSESSRKGSCSSIGSGASGIEEIEKHTCDTAPINVYDIQGPGPGVGMKYDSKTGEVISGSNSTPASASSKPSSKVSNSEMNRGSSKKSTSGKNTSKSGGADKAFFDPKRIFCDKDKQAPNNKNYIPNNQQNLRKDEEDHVFNNGKAKSNLKSGSARYINNDLRDSSKKQTNTESRNTGTSNVYSESLKDGERPSSSSNTRKRSDNGTNTRKTASSASQTNEEHVKAGGKRVKKEKVPDTSHVLGEFYI